MVNSNIKDFFLTIYFVNVFCVITFFTRTTFPIMPSLFSDFWYNPSIGKIIMLADFLSYLIDVFP